MKDTNSTTNNNIFNVGEWVIIGNEYKQCDWYYDKPMRVVDIHYHEKHWYHNTYVKKNDGEIIILATMYLRYYPMRKHKLERILDEII